MQEIAERYKNAIRCGLDGNRDRAETELAEIAESPNGRLQDLRDYTTRLRELYTELWEHENQPTWLPNILQAYDAQSAMWREKIVASRNGRKYLKTTTDGDRPDNLLSLAECKDCKVKA